LSYESVSCNDRWKVGVKKLHRSVSNKGLFVTNYRGMLRNCDISLLLHCL